MKLDMSEEAILIWVDKGQKPSMSDFSAPETPVDDASRPRGRSPEPYHALEDAIDYAIGVERSHDKEPWIKVGEHILGPSEIQQAYTGLKAMRKFDGR